MRPWGLRAYVCRNSVCATPLTLADKTAPAAIANTATRLTVPMDINPSVFLLRLRLLPALFDDLAVEQMNRAVRKLGIPRIVSYHADGRTLSVQLTHQVHHRLAIR